MLTDARRFELILMIEIMIDNIDNVLGIKSIDFSKVSDFLLTIVETIEKLGDNKSLVVKEVARITGYPENDISKYYSTALDNYKKLSKEEFSMIDSDKLVGRYNGYNTELESDISKALGINFSKEASKNTIVKELNKLIPIFNKDTPLLKRVLAGIAFLYLFYKAKEKITAGALSDLFVMFKSPYSKTALLTILLSKGIPVTKEDEIKVEENSKLLKLPTLKTIVDTIAKGPY